MAFSKLYDIDEFIADNPINSRIYKVLIYLQDSNDNERVPLKRKPIEIFNQTYYIYDWLNSKKHPENEVQTIWDKTLETFLEFETNIVFACVYVVMFFSETENPHITYCLHRIKNFVSENYFVEFIPILEEDISLSKSLPQNFQQLKEKADSITDLNEKLLFYNDILTRYKQSKNKGNILQQIEDEIELIKRTNELTAQQVETESNVEIEQTTASTKVRSVIIMELLKKMNCGKSTNDLTNICRLIAFLTGRSYDKIYNETQKGIYLTNHHKKEIEEANKILSALNTNISISKDKQY